MSTDSKLPLKLVHSAEVDFFSPGGGGSPPKVFGAVTPATRQQLVNGVQGVAAHFQADFTRSPKVAAVARVLLKQDALAKSHRPSALLNGAGCPIIGVGEVGELLVSVKPPTLARLERAVLFESSKLAIANLSTIRAIQPFGIDDERLDDLAKVLQRDKDRRLKLRLFRHQDEHTDSLLERALLAQLTQLKIRVEPLNYAKGISIFRLSDVKPEALPLIAQYIGTQSLDVFPMYQIVRPSSQPVARLTEAIFPPPDPSKEYPTVGVIDSGIDPSNALLSPWVIEREEFVPLAERDYEHGTFVGGLLVHARLLNHGNPEFPHAPCRLLDVVAVPRGGQLSEDELLAIIRTVVSKHPEIKVWNLSLAGNRRCSDYTFSDLAVALDEIQSTHSTTFVLAAGNYGVHPFRDWPPTLALGEEDRICGPADSARALTVGSVAHLDSAASRVRAKEPSPFSRRGPGPVYLPKPEISHFGGNCDRQGRHAQIGVLSVDAKGNLAEDIGTSFAAPIAAATLANVQFGPTGAISNLMAKALVIQSAAMQSPFLSGEDLDYRGFGVPYDVPDILGCDPWNATFLFEVDIRAGLDYHRTPLPMPACLRTQSGTLRGEITATLVYEPPLDATFGAEYCRTNIELSIGVFDLDDDGKRYHKGHVPIYPKRTASRQEKSLIEQGFKWSPIKVYRRIVPKGVQGDVWRLKLDATDRNGAINQHIKAAVVVTIADPERQAPVYNDVVVAMQKLGWATTDIQLRQRARHRT